MSELRDDAYLQHIIDAIDRIASYVANLTPAQFHESVVVQDAVIRQLQIVGEASKRLTEDFRNQHPEVPWHKIAGMRNRLVHDYLGVDIDAVWVTATRDLPMLRSQLTE